MFLTNFDGRLKGRLPRFHVSFPECTQTYPKGPSTQYLRFPVPRTIPFINGFWDQDPLGFLETLQKKPETWIMTVSRPYSPEKKESQPIPDPYSNFLAPTPMSGLVSISAPNLPYINPQAPLKDPHISTFWSLLYRLRCAVSPATL